MSTVWVHDRKEELTDEQLSPGDFVLAPDGGGACVGEVAGGPERPASRGVDWFATVDREALPDEVAAALAGTGEGLRRPDDQEPLLRAVRGIAEAHRNRGG